MPSTSDFKGNEKLLPWTQALSEASENSWHLGFRPPEIALLLDLVGDLGVAVPCLIVLSAALPKERGVDAALCLKPPPAINTLRC